MKKNLLFFLMGTCVYGPSAFAVSYYMDWTNDSDSPQAILYVALQEYKASLMADPQFTMYLPELLSRPRTVSLNTREGSIVCDSATEGALAVEQYRCRIDFFRRDLRASTSARSMSAVLYNALDRYLETQPGSGRLRRIDEFMVTLAEDGVIGLGCDVKVVTSGGNLRTTVASTLYQCRVR